jgi:hypothetical protein
VRDLALSDPTWPNHAQISGAAGLRVAHYPFVDESGALRFEDRLAALRTESAGDLDLIHGSCHNPTEVDLIAQWRTLANTLAERSIAPLVDLAYQGFEDGLDEDAAGLRLLVSKVPESLIAVSCSRILRSIATALARRSSSPEPWHKPTPLRHGWGAWRTDPLFHAVALRRCGRFHGSRRRSSAYGLDG